MPSGRDIFEPKLGLTLPLCGLHFVFFFLLQADSQRTQGLFAFQPHLALQQPWTFLTYQFLEYTPLGLFFGTMFLYFLGTTLEAEWGTREMTIFWLVATLGASGAAFLLGQPLLSGSAIVNVSMVFACGLLFPDMTLYMFFVLPVKMKWMAWLTAGYVGYRFFVVAGQRGVLGGVVEVIGMAAGFLYFWTRHHAPRRARRVAVAAVAAVKSAGAVRDDAKLEQRNRALFPRVEAARGEARAGTPLPAPFEEELRLLVVNGVKICKPVDFKGDRDGICVRCEGFAECSLRYLAGQPEEIVIKERK